MSAIRIHDDTTKIQFRRKQKKKETEENILLTTLAIKRLKLQPGRRSVTTLSLWVKYIAK